nr:MAG TPA: hypothetical protein [Caudoviricetes sp.]
MSCLPPFLLYYTTKLHLINIFCSKTVDKLYLIKYNVHVIKKGGGQDE